MARTWREVELGKTGDGVGGGNVSLQVGGGVEIGGERWMMELVRGERKEVGAGGRSQK